MEREGQKTPAEEGEEIGSGEEQETPSLNLYKWKKRLRRMGTYFMLFALLLLYFQLEVYTIPPGDYFLYPEYSPGQRVLYDRFCFYHRGIMPVPTGEVQPFHRYNPVVIYIPWKGGKLRRLGRVMGLPGETYSPSPKEKTVTIGGEEFSQLTPQENLNISKVPSHHYLILYGHPEKGAILALVPKKQILGKVILIW